MKIAHTIREPSDQIAAVMPEEAKAAAHQHSPGGSTSTATPLNEVSTVSNTGAVANRYVKFALTRLWNHGQSVQSDQRFFGSTPDIISIAYGPVAVDQDQPRLISPSIAVPVLPRPNVQAAMLAPVIDTTAGMGLGRPDHGIFAAPLLGCAR